MDRREQIADIARKVVSDTGRYAFAYTERGAEAVVRRVLAAAWPYLALQPDVVVGEGWRPEVRAFANLMERELRANDHKGGWAREHPGPLMDRLWEEAHELSVYFGPGSRTDYSTWSAQIGAEAADVANFAMMIADVCGALPAAPALSTSPLLPEGEQGLSSSLAESAASACGLTASETPRKSEVREPTESGGYRGDIWFGDDEERTLPTHRWSGDAWERVHDL
jgi:hypothetical protein